MNELFNLLFEANNVTYKDASEWYALLVKHIEVDPEVSKRPLEEKIKLLKMMLEKFKAEVKNPSGWSLYLTAMVTIIPYANIYLYFAQNGNSEVLRWMLTSQVPLPNVADAKNENKYKIVMSKMLKHTTDGISFLRLKLQKFDEKAAKLNPIVANLNLIYKIINHSSLEPTPTK